MSRNETRYTNFCQVDVQPRVKLYNREYNTVILFYHYIANARPRLLNNNESSLSYLLITFTSPSLQKCHLATNTEAIDSFGKVGGREARPNANFQLSSRVECTHGSLPTTKTREEKRPRIYSHEPRTTILKQAGVNAREKVSS